MNLSVSSAILVIGLSTLSFANPAHAIILDTSPDSVRCSASTVLDTARLDSISKTLVEKTRFNPKLNPSELDTLQRIVLNLGAQFRCAAGWRVRPPVAFLIQIYKSYYPERKPGFLAALRASPSATLREIGYSEMALDEVTRVPMEMRFTALDGRIVDLSAMRGKVVLIDFWDTGCLPCIREFPLMKELYQKYKDQGFEIIGVAVEDDSSRKPILEKMMRDKQIPWPQHFDPRGIDGNDYMRRFGFAEVPHMLLLDRNGLLVSTNAIGKRLEPLVRQYLGLNGSGLESSEGKTSQISDSVLTMELMGKFVAAHRKIDSLVKARPDLKFLSVSDTLTDLREEIVKNFIAKKIEQCSSHPEIVTALKEAGFSPESYFRLDLRLWSAWSVFKVGKELERLGYSLSNVAGGLPSIPDSDLAFISAHSDELKKLGLHEPNPQMQIGSEVAPSY